MPKVVIVGAGVFGLTIALSLPRHYDVTIVARDMPGDPDSLDWASPWAGAGFGGGGTKPDDPEETEMIKAAFRYYWALAETHPESSVKKMREALFRDNVATDADLWWKDFMPDYRIMHPSELPPASNAKIGISYTSLVLTPPTYLSYLAALLRASPNVAFLRKTVAHLAELLPLAPDVIVNATGVGAAHISPVNDPDVEPVRGQTILIRQPEVDRMTLRSGIDYCYVIPRGDGTVVIGGIKEHGSTSPEVDPATRRDIAARAHQLDPRVPGSVPALDVVRDIVGIRPGRRGGMRVEAEVLKLGEGEEGEREVPVVHAYGARRLYLPVSSRDLLYFHLHAIFCTSICTPSSAVPPDFFVADKHLSPGAGGTGYALSPGVGRKVAALVDEFVMGDKFPRPGKGAGNEEKGRCSVM
ncbi:nucleotide-binding domain-containing protein [Neolentinus lepideus HHB14362 ss-1]|uniref:Nucleotide-binding domain-containing protein n=1 Tax=Neolentinus lepideus HHB14362 ss-1 TaxID=1314782 RepID=A0A165MD86_9AGAM|nr:nucleotide-binding domain-containing protein [Neolentinus lepideus HHB14362 ss-1]